MEGPVQRRRGFGGKLADAKVAHVVDEDRLDLSDALRKIRKRA